MKKRKFIFTGISFCCALLLCTGQPFASETDVKKDARQVEKSEKKNDTKAKSAEKEEKKSQPKKSHEEKTPYLFSDDFTNLL